MHRRRFIVDSSAVLASALLPVSRLLAGAGDDLPAGTLASSSMHALAGKRPLIKRTYRPPNYETPVELFRQDFTPNDAFYVRWHASVPDIALRDWRLRVLASLSGSPREYAYCGNSAGTKSLPSISARATDAGCSGRTSRACNGAMARWATRSGAACD